MYALYRCAFIATEAAIQKATCSRQAALLNESCTRSINWYYLTLASVKTLYLSQFFLSCNCYLSDIRSVVTLSTFEKRNREKLCSFFCKRLVQWPNLHTKMQQSIIDYVHLVIRIGSRLRNTTSAGQSSLISVVTRAERTQRLSLLYSRDKCHPRTPLPLSFSLAASRISSRPYMTGSLPDHGVGRKKVSLLLFDTAMFSIRKSKQREATIQSSWRSGYSTGTLLFSWRAAPKVPPFYQIITDRERKVLL